MPNSSSTFAPDWISPPGDTIADILQERGWKQGELAMRLGYTQKHVSLLINGKVPITVEAAQRLSRVLGSTAKFWLTLEANYQSEKLRVQSAQELESWITWTDSFPVRRLQHDGILESQRRTTQTMPGITDQLLRFFGVASPAEWKQWYLPIVSSGHSEVDARNTSENVATWLRMGELHAESLHCPAYSRTRFKRVLTSLRGLTQEPPAIMLVKMQELLLHAGVVLAVIPNIAPCTIFGAARSLNSRRPLIQMSPTGLTNDVFWRTFFHEAAHLLLHMDDRKDPSTVYFDSPIRANPEDQREQQADAWARNMLIPSQHDDKLRALTTKRQIQLFAKSIDIHPGIVVGILQDDGIVKRSAMNELKVTMG